MTVGISSTLKKIKKRRILVLFSSGGSQGGVQCLYIVTGQNSWELISHITLPFTQRINSLYEKIHSNAEERCSIEDISILDFKITQFCLDAIKTIITPLSTQLKKPHYIVFNKPQFWRGLIGENNQQIFWDFSSGDSQLISSTVNVPVFSDFIRNNILAGGPGILPFNPGSQVIASRKKGKVILINIGIIAHITIVNSDSNQILSDTDIGPGTVLLNQTVSTINSAESFDRDGTMASQGKVDSQCLDELANFDWFQAPCPKYASPEQFSELLNNSTLKFLSSQDRIATITALTARIIYDYCRKESISQEKDMSIYISGGGALNQTLIDFLKTYFDPIAVNTIEELGVPVDMYTPLAFGLTVDAFLTDNNVPRQTGNTPMISSIGRWVVP
ncbi:MAG TPA: anhydro-N-acetylmuramic acid kinase [Chitinispirillaceae bacterium]|nr:anhydro-N-acetylmuramic acid kinase [Chitinispirillaceae bacterium]